MLGQWTQQMTEFAPSRAEPFWGGANGVNGPNLNGSTGSAVEPFSSVILPAPIRERKSASDRLADGGEGSGPF